MIPLLVLTMALGQSSNISQGQKLAEPLRLAGDLDRRSKFNAQSLTPSWSATVELKQGRAAGLIFWADSELKSGYSVRLDARLGELILSRIGPWPQEERLARCPWSILDGRKVHLSIQAANGTIRVWAGKDKFAILEAANAKPAGGSLGFLVWDGEASFSDYGRLTESKMDVSQHTPKVGAFKHIFDQSVGEKEGWYINDHCFFQGPNGWNLWGITHAKPANPMDERHFAHATSPTLDSIPWKKQPFALSWDQKLGENHLWAPHVIQKGDTYYMFYCAGSLESNFHFRIHLATSRDLKTWTRHKGNPLFKDFFDARDPMVLLIDGTYYMYYTANLDREKNHHVVNVRTSKNLLDWSPAKVALTHETKGTFGGPTESPFVVRYGDHFYLFIGPDGDYRTTKVYRSPNPTHWEYKPIYSFPSHAAEVIQDKNGSWYASNCGWDLDGVYLAPLTWERAK